MAVLTLSEMIASRVKACAESGESLGDAFRGLIAEAGPLQVFVHNIGHSAQPATVTGAGADFLVFSIEGLKHPFVAPFATMEWLTFDSAA